MTVQDVIIIGSGPAGISASLYTQRANLKTTIISTGQSALARSSAIENYYGFENPVSGEELLENGIKQAERLGVSILKGEVTSIEIGTGFVIRSDIGELETKAVLIATGSAPLRPRIPGIKELEGRGVSYCTTCDGFFFKKKKVGVLGGGNFAVQEAMELLPFTEDITLFTNASEPAFTGEYAKNAERFRICRERITGLKGEGKLQSIQYTGGDEPLDGLFVALGSASSVDFAVKLGVATEGNAIIVDKAQCTNIPGIFAAGDCTGGFKQVSIAVGQGAMAGKNIVDYVRQH